MNEYVSAALRHAQYEHDSDGSAYGTVALDTGITVSASGRNYHACRTALRHMLENEIGRALRSSRALPVIDGIVPPVLE